MSGAQQSQSEAVSEALKLAAAAVEESGIDADLRQIAFGRAFDALMQGTGAPAVQEQPTISTKSAPPTSGSGSVMADQIARSLGVSLTTTQAVYDEIDGELVLALSSTQLPQNRAEAIRLIALLVVVGRQAAGIEEETDFAAIREECKELKVFDQANFAAHVEKVGFRIKGKGSHKTARATRPHRELAATELRRLGGETNE